MRITLQFDLSRDIDGAARDIQARMAAIESRMWPSVGLRGAD
jgi:multidrug efflux pump subunit AcrB